MLFKLADVVVEIPAGSRPFWGLPQHEPLLLAILLPFSCDSPWQHRQSDRILELAGELRVLWKSPNDDEWRVLRQFFACT